MLIWTLATIPDGTMILYDGTSVPSGWQAVATFDGRFPRACTPAGSVGGSEYHTHLRIFGFLGAPDPTTVRGGATGDSGATDSHSHDLWGGDTCCHVDSAYHVPPYRKFLLIRKVGEGYTLPAGAVLFFEDSSFSSRWQVILRDTFPRATADTSQVGEAGGVEWHYHTFEGWTGPPTRNEMASGGSFPTASSSHRHHYTGNTYGDTTKPPYILWFVARLAVDTEDIPIGAIAMFDYEPSGSPEVGEWAVPLSLEAAGGDDAGLLPRGAGDTSQLGRTGGSDCHWHRIDDVCLDDETEASELCYGPGDCDDYYYSNEFADYGHMHYIYTPDYRTDTACNILPPYRCVLFRKKISPSKVSQGASAAGRVRVLGRILVLEGFAGREVEVYSPSGQLLLRRKLRFGREAFRVPYPAGVYILKIGSLVRKVVLK